MRHWEPWQPHEQEMPGLRGFRKGKLIVDGAPIRMRGKLEMASQGRKPEGQQTSEAGEDTCASNCSDLQHEGKGSGKEQVLG